MSTGRTLREVQTRKLYPNGVPPEQIRDAFRQAARFHAQPLDKKREVRIDRHNVGYLPMRGDTLRTSTVQTVTKPNLNEAFFVARDLPADHPDVVADPLPQALVLTAIVIGFATTGFVIELALRSRHESGTDHVDGHAPVVHKEGV